MDGNCSSRTVATTLWPWSRWHNRPAGKARWKVSFPPPGIRVASSTMENISTSPTSKVSARAIPPAIRKAGTAIFIWALSAKSRFPGPPRSSHKPGRLKKTRGCRKCCAPGTNPTAAESPCRCQHASVNLPCSTTSFTSSRRTEVTIKYSVTCRRAIRTPRFVFSGAK